MTLFPLYSSSTSLSMQVDMYACSESIFFSDLSLDKHVSSVSANCFYYLRQLDVSGVRLTLIRQRHSFRRSCLRDVACRLLQCNPRRGSEDNRQAIGLRVLNAAARVISDIKKFDQGLSRLMHQELHWLDIPERVKYKLGVLTHQCLLGKAPVYLSNCCIPVSQVATRRQLRSAARHQLTVPRHHFSTYGRRSFAVAGPTMFNNLPDDLRDPEVSTTTFGSR